MTCQNGARPAVPVGVAASVFLLVAEFVAACVTAALYGTAGDPTWLGLTLLFALVASLAVQLALVVIHRDIGRDRPLVLMLHLLQMGALVRAVEVTWLYCRMGKQEEPYASITHRTRLSPSGSCTDVVREIGRGEGRLYTHRQAFFRTAVLQAFLGSAPQLSLQLYISIREQEITPARGVLMSFSLLATAYGAVILTFLAIRLEHPSLELGAAPAAYVLALIWRSLEMAARVSALVLFAASCRAWCFLVILANLAIFAVLPWIGAAWRCCSARKQNIQVTDTEEGKPNRGFCGQTCCLSATRWRSLAFLTALFAAVALFCWPAARFRPDSPDFVARKHSWVGVALYYGLRFAENSALIGGWLVCRSAAPLSSGGFLCGPAVAAQIGAAFGLSLILMLVFYQFAHPARRLMRRNVADLCPPSFWRRGDGARAVDTAGVGEAV
uniref:endoplasmic reticulum membrane adapter protein XK-like isoform X1 n=1 Tax=Myxine glutinosa TaxID=7769 RepID=UPI00358EEF8C